MIERIINIINTFKEISPYNLYKELNISKKEYSRLNEILKQLELDGIIYYDIYRNVYSNLPSNFLLLEVDVNKKGQLFASIEGTNYEFLPESLTKILPFDRIIAKLVGNHLKVIKVLKRENPYIICKILANNKIQMVGNKNLALHVPKKYIKNFKVGSRILVKLTTTIFHDEIECENVSVFPDDEELALAYNNGFTINYSKDELDQISSLPKRINPHTLEKFTDYRSETVFTIDDEDTFDLDDAISIQKLSDGSYILKVYIANVEHFIGFNTPLWQRAQRLTTSTYTENGPIFHMLHPDISCGICSLMPKVDRLAKGFIFKISPDGKILDFKIEDSLIRSKKKMTYKEVDNILNGMSAPKSYYSFIEDLINLEHVTNLIISGLSQDTTISYEVNEENLIKKTEIENKHQPSKMIIMICAVLVGKSVAEYLYNAGLLMVYRNHENSYYEEFKRLLKKYNKKVKAFDKTQDEYVINKIIDSIKNKEEFLVFTSLIINSASKAYYDIKNVGHYALNTEAYSHTTSPIRRFSDLLIQFILNHLEEIYSGNFNLEEFKKYLKEMTHRCTIMEKMAEKFTNEYVNLQKIRAIITAPNNLIARITNLNDEFITIKLEDNTEGFIKLEDFEDGLYRYNKGSKYLYHIETKNIIMPGTTLLVNLKDYNLEYRRINFYGNVLSKDNLLKRKK